VTHRHGLVDVSRAGTGWIGTGVATIALGAVALAGLPTGAGASTPPNSAHFTFSGVLKGTLHGDPCSGTPTLGGQFEFDASKLKGSTADTWTVNVNIGKDKVGTFTHIKPNPVGVTPASVVLLGQAATKEYDWITTSGTITTTRTSGSVKVTLGPDHTFAGVPGKGPVKITGSWNCPG
jgi:hypothetical protein